VLPNLKSNPTRTQEAIADAESIRSRLKATIDKSEELIKHSHKLIDALKKNSRPKK